MMELLLDAGVDDIKTEDGNIVIYTAPDIFNDVNDIINEKKLKTSVSEITYVPTTNVSLDEKKAGQCMRLVDQMENHDDVQNVYSNYDISDEIMKKISEEQ
jgi:transcriptional/translational regulatory protein YebC/TACO1